MEPENNPPVDPTPDPGLPMPGGDDTPVPQAEPPEAPTPAI